MEDFRQRRALYFEDTEHFRLHPQSPDEEQPHRHPVVLPEDGSGKNKLGCVTSNCNAQLSAPRVRLEASGNR